MLSDRINIQYSIDAGELPAEIQRLIAKVEDHLVILNTENIPSLKNMEGKNILSLNTLEEVDLLRRRLAAADYVLNDIVHIIGAYLQFKVKEQTTDEPSPAPPAPQDDEPIELHANTLFNDLGELQQKVDELNKET